MCQLIFIFARCIRRQRCVPRGLCTSISDPPYSLHHRNRLLNDLSFLALLVRGLHIRYSHFDPTKQVHCLHRPVLFASCQLALLVIGLS